VSFGRSLQDPGVEHHPEPGFEVRARDQGREVELRTRDGHRPP